MLDHRRGLSSERSSDIIDNKFSDFNIIFLMLQVHHSQRLNDKPLTPWIVSMADGRIIAGHCDCTAGLGETCSHIATLLWVLAVGVEKRESLTVTQKSAYWVMPPPMRSVPYAPIKDIEFIGKKKKACDAAENASCEKRARGSAGDTSCEKRARGAAESASCEKRASGAAGDTSCEKRARGAAGDTSCEKRASGAAESASCEKRARDAAGDTSCGTNTKCKTKVVNPPTAVEEKKFLDSLVTCDGVKPVVLSVLPTYCDSFIPSSLDSDLPFVLDNLFKSSFLKCSFYELLAEAKQTVLPHVSEDQCKTAERMTRDQSNCRLWFRLRAGRITASKLKGVCSTDPAFPSLSLIMAICHPELSRFSTAATRYGCQHEKDAIDVYKKKMSTHADFQISPSGFFISRQHSFLGASPDSIVCCSCCGPGICEVKVIISMLCMM